MPHMLNSILFEGMRDKVFCCFINFNKVFLFAGLPIIGMTLIFMLIIPFCIRNSTSKITRGIIHLYEQLDEFLKKQNKTKNHQLKLTFKKSAYELNKL